jgi:hypothetical protein
MESSARPVSRTPAQVTDLLDHGVLADQIVRLLVATGPWSDSAAAEIVSKLPRAATPWRCEAEFDANNVGWPRPPDDSPLNVGLLLALLLSVGVWVALIALLVWMM